MLKKLINDFKYIKMKKCVQEKKLSLETKTFLLKYFYWCKSISEAIYNYKNNIRSRPICEFVGCENTKNYSATLKYSSGCSHNHSTKLNLLSKYGVENISQLQITKEKIKNTSLTKFGVSNIFKSTVFKENLIKHNLKKYGVEYVSQSPIIINKIKETNLKKYNVSCSLHSASSKIKTTASWKRKYNVSHFSKNKKIQEKRLSTRKINFLEKFTNSLNNDFKILFDFSEYSKKHNTYPFICEICKCNFNFTFTTNHIYPRCPNCNPIRNNNVMESDLFNSINFNQKYQNNRTLLNGKELDIYIPDKKLAIEFNGIYWHSEANGKDKNYHLDKTIKCEAQNIQLLHIFESEWIEKKEIILSLIHAKLGIFNNRIHARNCIVKEIDSTTKNDFLKANYLTESDDATLNFGLFNNNNLVSVMTFGKNKIDQWVIYSYCSKLNYQVIGGISKLWSYFLRNFKPIDVIIYIDHRFSQGLIFKKLGFRLLKILPPEPWVFGKDINGLVKMRDVQCLLSNAQYKVWDCGKFKLGWFKNLQPHSHNI